MQYEAKTPEHASSGRLYELSKEMDKASHSSLFKKLAQARKESLTGAVLIEDSPFANGMFDDDVLLHTHPLDMTDEMLNAAQVRINESSEFAEKYRNSTDYKSVADTYRGLEKRREKELPSLQALAYGVNGYGGGKFEF